MKKILFFPLLVLFFTNCQKMLRPEETSIGKITSYDQLVSATNGLYGALAKIVAEGDLYIPNLKGDDLNTDIPSYNSYYGQNQQCYSAGSLSLYNSSTSWEYLYSAIATANNILKQYNLALIKDKLTKEALGEIYFIRAFCYFRLTRTYGQIPLIKNIDISYTTTKATYSEIYGFIESDLIMAMELLPENNSSARVPFVTAHRGTVKAFLAELYLSWAGYPIKDNSKYTLAAKQAGECIDSSGYFGFGLLTDFANVWDTAHLTNSESVFSVYFGKFTNFSFQANPEAPYKGYVSPVSGLILSPYSNPIIIFFYPTEVNFYNNFPTGYRKDITFFKKIYIPIYKGLADTGYIDIQQVSTCNRIGYRKFYYQHIEDKNASSSASLIEGIPRVYIFRFPQTMLTYAEAMARSGLLDTKAYDCVNQIRRRAHQLNLNSPSAFDLPSGLSPTAFADSVVQERAWELCGEPEGRWFDLVRLELVEDLPTLRNPAEGGPPSVFDKSVYFSPIPAADTVLNPNIGK
jgi:hypothetical protein